MIIRLRDVEPRRLDVAPIEVRRVLNAPDSERLAVTWMSLDGVHPTVVLRRSDTVYCFRGGSGEITVGNADPHPVAAGDFAYVPAGTPYSYKGNLEYLVVQSPPIGPGDVTFPDLE